MKIQALDLQSFRNYTKASLQFSEDIVLIIGDNAQGKTNLVEAIYTLAFSKSYRTKLTKDLVKETADFAKIKANITFETSQKKQIEYILTPKSKKIKVNNVEQKLKSDFVGLIKLIKFSPEDLSLIKGSPQVRRRFIDMYLSQFDKEYLYAIVQYNHILKQKNALLKNDKVDHQLLTIYNEKLAIFIAQIVKKRKNFIETYVPIVQKIFTNIVDNTEKFTMTYDTAFQNMTDSETILTYLNEQSTREMKYYGVLVGTHKDDLSFYINDKNARQFGSQGQQRTIVLSLIIALVEYIYQTSGEYPILVLDDVMSELDDKRKVQLLASFVSGMQIFMTTTSVEDIKEMITANYELYEVVAGSIKKIDEKIR